MHQKGDTHVDTLGSTKDEATGGKNQTTRAHSADCRAQEAQRRREADAMQTGFEAGIAKSIVHGYDAAFWNESYELLRAAILQHLPAHVHDDDVAEEAILVKAIEDAGEDLRADRAVCLCGCPPDVHENYGEDGESCGNDDHDCIRVSVGVAQAFARVRAGAKAGEAQVPVSDSTVNDAENTK
jgi:hypothetical protein